MIDQVKILFENDDFLAIDKPAGVLVHPTEAGEKDTLVDWLREKYPAITKLAWPDKARPGIVHRLDKDTSGVMVLAKNPETLARLQELFKTREVNPVRSSNGIVNHILHEDKYNIDHYVQTKGVQTSNGVKKTYQALVLGETPASGKIEIGIVRDAQKDQMKVQETAYSFTKGTVRPAVTLYKTIRPYTYNTNALSLVEVMPQTGRMHQIRVHLKYAGFPVIGDPLYNTKESQKISKELNLGRQFLHAVKLEFESYKFETELAEDLQKVLNTIV